MLFSKNEISQVVQEIWRSVLGLSVEEDAPSEDGAVGRSLAGSVQISGEYELAVVVQLSAGLARRSAALMLCVEPEEASAEEIQDAMGELANMVGGSIKNKLPGRCRLSLPTVADGSNYTLRLPGTRLLHQYSFGCLGQPMHVTLFEREMPSGV